MGPPTRECKSGDKLQLKLMFYNRQAGKQSNTTTKPIRIMLYIHECSSGENAEDSYGFEEDEDHSGSTAEEEVDVVGDKIIFKVSYGAAE